MPLSGRTAAAAAKNISFTVKGARKANAAYAEILIGERPAPN